MLRTVQACKTRGEFEKTHHIILLHIYHISHIIDIQCFIKTDYNNFKIFYIFLSKFNISDGIFGASGEAKGGRLMVLGAGENCFSIVGKLRGNAQNVRSAKKFYSTHCPKTKILFGMMRVEIKFFFQINGNKMLIKCSTNV